MKCSVDSSFATLCASTITIPVMISVGISSFNISTTSIRDVIARTPPCRYICFLRCEFVVFVMFRRPGSGIPAVVIASYVFFPV